MIQIGNGHELCKLMEHRYDPMLCRLLRSVALRGEMIIVNANPGETCLPVREVWLSVGPYTEGQLSIMLHSINAGWQYDNARTQKCVEFVRKSHEKYLIARTCEETRLV